MEYCLGPVTTHTKDPPHQMNIEQIAENSWGTWPTVTSPLVNNRYGQCIQLLGYPFLFHKKVLFHQWEHSKHLYICDIPSPHLIL